MCINKVDKFQISSTIRISNRNPLERRSTMSSLPFYIELLARNEEAPSLRKPRHPIVYWSHIPFIGILFIVWYLFTDQTAEQTVPFFMAIGLYASSMLYHGLRPNRLLRCFDQTMIGLYIVAVPLPFVHQEPWAYEVFLAQSLFVAIIKGFELEKSDNVSKLVFLLLGICSATQVFVWGIPVMDGGYGGTAFWLLIAMIAGFLFMLWTYHKEFVLVPNMIEAAEIWHGVLWIPIGIHACLTVIYSV